MSYTELECLEMDNIEVLKKTIELNTIQQEMINKIIEAVKLQEQQIGALHDQLIDLITTVEKMDAHIRV